MRAQTLALLAGHRRVRVEVITERLVETIEADDPGDRSPGAPSRAYRSTTCCAGSGSAAG